MKFSPKKWAQKWAVLVLGSISFAGLTGCGGGDDPEKPGNANQPAPKVDLPTSGSDAIAQLNAAVKAVEETTEAEELAEATFQAEAKFLAIADYLADTEASKISDIVTQTKVKGIAQALRIQGQKLNELAQQNAEDRGVIDDLVTEIKRQIKNLSDLL